MKRLYVDDTRPTPAGWDIAIDYFEAIKKLQTIEYDEVSLDHDLASYDENNREKTGYDIVWFLVNRKMDGLYVPSKVKVHSANIIGSKNMQNLVDKYL